MTLRTKGQDHHPERWRGSGVRRAATSRSRRSGDCTIQAHQSARVQAKVSLALQGPAGVNINHGALEVI